MSRDLLWRQSWGRGSQDTPGARVRYQAQGGKGRVLRATELLQGVREEEEPAKENKPSSRRLRGTRNAKGHESSGARALKRVGAAAILDAAPQAGREEAGKGGRATGFGHFPQGFGQCLLSEVAGVQGQDVA